MSSSAPRCGPYELLEPLASGGMAEVIKACRRGPNGMTLVALKRVLPALAGDDDYRAMFRDEARLSSRLSHPNVVRAVDSGVCDGAPYIAFEYVAGVDMRALFEEARLRGTVVPPALAAHVVAELLSALDHAHTLRDAEGRPLGLVHRDVSPRNVLVSFDGEVKLIDFGVAHTAGRVHRTEEGMLKGKFGYMSPEQVRGAPLDGRSDLFAAGILLHELLTGSRLFTGADEAAVLERVRGAMVPRPTLVRADVPPPLEWVAMRSLARLPDDRFPDAGAMQAELRRYLQSQPFDAGALASWVRGRFPSAFEADRASRRALATRAPRPLPDGEPTLTEAVPPAPELLAALRAAQSSESDAPEGTPTVDARRPRAPVPAIAQSSAPMTAKRRWSRWALLSAFLVAIVSVLAAMRR